MRRALLASLLSAGCVIVSAYAVELYLQLHGSDPRADIARAAARAGAVPDERSVAQVVQALEADGVQAQPFFRLINRATRLMPLGNTPHRAIVVCNESGRYLIERADRHGFNNPDQVWDAPRFELALVGDSFVQGFCDPDGRSFANLLRADVPGLLNLGMGGNGPQLDLATLVEYAAPLGVQRVIWFHYAGNDLREMTEQRSHPVLRRYVEDGATQGLLARRDEVEETMDGFHAAHTAELLQKAEPGALVIPLDWKRVVRLAALRDRFGLTWKAEASFDYAYFTKVVERARSTAAEHGMQLAFVILPDERQVEAGTDDPVLRRTEEALRSAGVPVFDLSPVFREAGVERVFAFGRNGGHLSTRGNEIVAQFVRERVLPALAWTNPTAGAAP